MSTNPKEVHPFDRREPVTVDAGTLYMLICCAAIAQGKFDGSDDAKNQTLLAAYVGVPYAKRLLIEQAGWDPYGF